MKRKSKEAESEPVQTELCPPPAVFQPSLFEEFADQPQLVKAAKQFLHTGKITTKDEELCNLIIEAKLSGLYSNRAIARKLHVGRETIDAVVDFADKAGKLGPLKERLKMKMGYAIELGVETIIEKMKDGTMQPNVLPIVVGVLSDKKGLLDGVPTMIVGTSAGELTLEQLNAKIAALPALAGAVIDVPSDSGSTDKPS